MAQLAAPGPGRISQLLPAVKCSSCAVPVPLDELGDHVCAPAPPMPKLSAAVAAAGFASRLQNLVATSRQANNASPQPPGASKLQQQQQQSTTRLPPPPQPAPAPAPAPPTARPLTPNDRLRINTAAQSPPRPSLGQRMNSSPLARSDLVRTASPGVSQQPSASTPSHSPLSARVASPGPAAPSNISRITSPAPSGRIHSPAPSTRINSPAPAMRMQPPAPPPISSSVRLPPPSNTIPMRDRAASNASSVHMPSLPQSNTTYNGHPNNLPNRARAPSNASSIHMPPLPSSYQQHPQGQQRPSQYPIPPNQQQIPRSPSTNPSMYNGHMPPPQQQQSQPAYPSYPAIPEPDTKSGGEAGMAGVGRRGFAAAARAAMFAVQHSPAHPAHPPIAGMNGRRLSPGRLDIPSAASSIRSSNTPPLSPNSGYSSHSPGPVSLSPQTLTSSSISFFDKITLDSASPTAIPEPERKPSLASSQASGDSSALNFGLFGPASDIDENDEDEDHERKITMESPPSSPISSGSEYGLAYADETDDEDGPPPPITAATPPKSILRSPSNAVPRDSPSQERKVRTLLPDRDSQVSDTSTVIRALNIRKKKSDAGSSESSYSTLREEDEKHGVLGPEWSGSVYSSSSSSSSDKRSKRGSLADDVLGDAHIARLSKTSMGSVYSRNTTVERAMETVWEEGGGALAALVAKSAEFISQSPVRESMAKRSNTVAHLPDATRTNAVKLPARAKTERESRVRGMQNGVASGSGAAAAQEPGTPKKKKIRVCIRCEKKIDDGRWVKVESEGGGVLCERCWKNMYLPKCRRCNLPIENQAVSSSDGQLKGKYHKDCFNCHKCHKPFPDKTFYVFEGRPLCAYHYHEANDSLCAATLCGKPIEGPCAISHAGDKYHPEHFLCEYPAEECKERLVEYWEVDGRMLCEKHSAWKEGSSGSDEGGGVSSRAQKRVTRFIDLGADGLDLTSPAAMDNRF